MNKTIEPQLGVESFSCPHCGALAHQSWYKVYIRLYEDSARPAVARWENIDKSRLQEIADDETRARVLEFVDRLEKNIVTYQYLSDSQYNRLELVNFSFSRCFSCKGFAAWVQDKLLYPSKPTTVMSHEDMPSHVREIFEEAATIVDLSSRGAAALLRLAIQALMPHLKEKGKDLNKDIGSLVKKGLEVEIQQALDVVRVIGNNAVHPGVIDLRDDKATAIRLFELVNLIVERRISTPKRIAALFGELPPGALDAITERDGPVQDGDDEESANSTDS